MTPDRQAEIERLLADSDRARRAYDWVDAVLARLDPGIDGGVALYPALAPGVYANEVNVCQDYSCQCGWNITISGRDPERRERLLTLAERPADGEFGHFKLLGQRENGRLWSVRIAGDDDLGLDAVVRVLLDPSSSE